MEKEDREILERMAKAQERIAGILGKPKGKTEIVLEYLTAIVSIMGVIVIIDVVQKWILGG
jgi:hypothetical protein